MIIGLSFGFGEHKNIMT